ncbi:MAG: hypothetical protein QXZ10_03565 [Sulfolobales archaeon]
MLIKGVSVVVSTLIMISMALILAMVLVGWVTGLWNALGATEVLQIIDANISANKLYLTLLNSGSASAKIVAVLAENSTKTFTGTGPNCLDKIINPGTIETLECLLKVDGDTTPPESIYVVKIITLSGTYIRHVKASP